MSDDVHNFGRKIINRCSAHVEGENGKREREWERQRERWTSERNVCEREKEIEK